MQLHESVERLKKKKYELARLQRLGVARNLLKILLVGFFIWKDTDEEISKLNAEKRLIGRSVWKYCLSATKEIDEQVQKINSGDTYLVHADKEQCLAAIRSFTGDLAYLDENRVFKRKVIVSIRRRLERYKTAVESYNKRFVERRKREYECLWKKAPLSLDEEQKEAVVTDDKHNLVVAAAGSGKTEVLITRVAYLIKRKPDTVEPRRILAIAYQRKAKEEIQQRLLNRFGIRQVYVRTFHKLGKDILEETGLDIRHVDIVDDNKKRDIIQGIFEQKIKNEPGFYKLFLQYVKTLHDKETQSKDVDEKGEVLSYAREQPYFCVNGTRVNSLAEKEILDFFSTHNLNGRSVKVWYEPDVDGFRPDFHLPRYDLFIEHWALNREGEVPDWFSQSSEEYKRSMEMKKRWFADHSKLLVETFAYEYDEEEPDRFIELLKERVIERIRTRNKGEFQFTVKPHEEILEIAWQSYRTPTEDIVDFVTTAKTYGLTPARIAERLQGMKWTRKQRAFGALALPVYVAYEEVLKKHGKVDFEDMINEAIEALDDDPALRADVYDHILIDEYQDISAQRHRLIERLMKRNPKCKLFCVGDDWQSIMGFSGSNLNFFVNFGKFFADPAVTIISTNYRSVQSIVDAGTALIKNNASCQIEKPTLSSRKETKPIRILRSPHKKRYENNYRSQTAEDCLNRISKYIRNGYRPEEILVLCRCMRTRVRKGYKFLSNIKIFKEIAKEKGIPVACDQADARNKIRLLTVHKSKGLEAKAVFVLNVIKDTYGFPCEIEDSSIHEPARMNYPPQSQIEEERRLFYVAMTRAMDDLYIYTWEPAKSQFLKEIEDHAQETRLRY